MTVAAGVGSIKGVYDGQVRLTDQQQPGSFRMHAQGAGAAGTIGADVLVTLEESSAGGTSVTYDADAVVGGMIGGVGQRMLVGVAKRMAAEFFGNVSNALSGADAELPADGGGAGTIRRFAPPAGPVHCRRAVGGPPVARGRARSSRAPQASCGRTGGSFGQGVPSERRPRWRGPSWAPGCHAGPSDNGDET